MEKELEKRGEGVKKEDKSPMMNQAIKKDVLVDRSRSREKSSESDRTSSVQKQEPKYQMKEEVVEKAAPKPQKEIKPEPKVQKEVKPAPPKKEKDDKKLTKPEKPAEISKTSSKKSLNSKTSRPKSAKSSKSSKPKAPKADTSHTFKVIVSKEGSIKDVRSVQSRSKSKKANRPAIQQPPMVFDLDEPSDRSDDYIFNKPAWVSSPKAKKRRKRKTKQNQSLEVEKVKAVKARPQTAIAQKAHVGANRQSRKPRITGVKEDTKTISKRPKTSKPQKKNTKNVQNPSRQGKYLGIYFIGAGSRKNSSSKKTKAVSKTGLKCPSEVDKIEDDGVMKVKIGKKGNEYTKPGFKKYNPNKTSYTAEVLDKLDHIQKYKPKPTKAKQKKKLSPETKAKVNLHRRAKKELEGLELNGKEIIRDLDQYFELHKDKLKGKDLDTIKIEMTKSILNDLQKYCLVK